jgi:predicted amidohydrolase
MLPSRPLRVAMCQCTPRNTVDESLAIVASVLSNNKNKNAAAAEETNTTRWWCWDIVIFSELFVQTYCAIACANTEASPARLREVSFTCGQMVERLAPMCRAGNVAVVIGYSELDGDVVYNSIIAVSAEGTLLANSRKAHLWGPVEKRLFTPASAAAPVFEFIGGWRIALTCCFDIEFPDYIRSIRLRNGGCHLLINPAGLVADGLSIVETMVPTRSMENEMFVAYSNDIGLNLQRPDAMFCGSGTICAPDGSVVLKCDTAVTPEDLQRVKPVEVRDAVLSFEKYAEALERNPYMRSRRPELYQ